MSFDSITSSFNRMEVSDIPINHVRAIYCNSCLTFINLIIMIIIAIQISPLVKDAGTLITDASISVHDFSILLPEIRTMLPEVSNILPEAQNTTRILGKLIPEIRQGMTEIAQLCVASPSCY